MKEIMMPRLSDTMEEGTITSWAKHVGDEVAVGETLAEIETDKAVMAYEAYEAGTLTQIVVGEGETAPIGAVIAVLDGEAPEGQRDAGKVEAPESRAKTESAESAKETVKTPEEPVVVAEWAKSD